MIDLFVLNTCPYCKKVMDFMDENNIAYNKFDTADNDNALMVLTIGGKDQVPFLYDKETNDKLYESNMIIEYLKKQGKNNEK